MKKFLLLFFSLFISVIIFAQTNFDINSLLKPNAGKELVTDYSGILTADQKQTLESKLNKFNDSTTQIAVIIVPSIGENDVTDLATKIGKAWGVGGKENNNGVVLLICTDPANHTLSIATGYGVEGALPDVTASEIIDDVIVPKFKGDDYYRGIDDGTDAIMQATRGAYTAPENYMGPSPLFLIALGFIVFILLILLPLFLVIRRGMRAGGKGFLGGLLLGSALSNGGSSGSSSSDSFSSSSDSGSSFSGFDGGDFGGGGASGSW
jgi:uncharacterized protein